MRYFSSERELLQLARCFAKIRPGDKVDVYLDTANSFTSLKTNSIAICTVVGVSTTPTKNFHLSELYPIKLLIGFNKDELKLRSGWSMASVKAENDTISDGYHSFASRNDLFGCPHGWWFNSPADGRIAKIHLARRPASVSEKSISR